MNAWMLTLTAALGVACAQPPSATPSLPVPPPPTVSLSPALPHHDTWTELDAAVVEALVTPRLPPGQSLAHGVFQGPLGGIPDVIVAVTSDGRHFNGFALVPGDPPRQVPIGAFDGFDWAATIDGLLFLDVDHDGKDDMVALAIYNAGSGPEAAVDFRKNIALKFDGAAWNPIDGVTAKIVDARDEAAVQRALRPVP